MEGKNLILAISLSALVLITWSVFFAPPPPPLDKEQNKIEKTQKKDEEMSSPSIETKKETSALTRVESLKSTKRISVENENIFGSIALTGGIIDDITFKNYNQNLNSENKVILLNPNVLDEGYYIETGWASTNKDVDLPNNKTEWSIVGNSKLTPSNPVTLKWTNNKQITFLKTIELDEKFLFKINQQIKNNGNNNYDFYPYAQIIRNKKLPLDERFAAQLKLTKLPKNSSRIRIRNRCEITGRPHGVYRKLKISRIALRELASSGKIPGMTKSSW